MQNWNPTVGVSQTIPQTCFYCGSEMVNGMCWACSQTATADPVGTIRALEQQLTAATQRAERAEKACAEMRQALFSIPCPNYGPQISFGATTQNPMPKPCGWCAVCKAKKELFYTDCGKGYVSKEELKPTIELLDILTRHYLVKGDEWEKLSNELARLQTLTEAAS